jgi:hypothetical protein
LEMSSRARSVKTLSAACILSGAKWMLFVILQ